MSIKVEVWIRRGSCGTRLRVTSAMFHFVAVGQDLRPRPLPPEDEQTRVDNF
jgi:acyl-CoA thioesterase YciA